ncbi:MAG: DEAD/DEAH box helicase [Anaerolineae bacterium]|nr:DEAD/DEAH box helicase [Anaerolineae bacterium]
MTTLVLHGTWSEGTFFLWAESDVAAPKPRGRQPKVPSHPQAASPETLRAALAEWMPGPLWYTLPEGTRVFLLPSLAQTPLLPPWLQSDAPDVDFDDALQLIPWKVSGIALNILAALDLLVGLPTRGQDRRWGTDLRYWSAVAKLGLELLSRQCYLPGLTENEGRYRAAWLPLFDTPGDQTRLRLLAEAMPPVCRAAFGEKVSPEPEQAPAPHVLLDDFLKQLVDAAVRDWGVSTLDKRRRAPDGIAGVWWEALWAVDGHILVPVGQRRDLARLYDAWREWLGQLRAAGEAAFRLCFRLEAPVMDPESGRVIQRDWRVRYLLQANDDPSLLVTVDKVWQARGGTLEYFTYRFENAQEQVLSGLGLAARLFPPILKSLRTARPEVCVLTVDEAYAFLREVGPLLEGSGFGVLVPPWWTKPGARLGVRAKAGLKADANIVGKGLLNLESLVAFDWELALGDEILSREEFERLVALKQPLVQVRGQWVLLQPEEIETAIAFWEKQRKQREMALRDALGITLGAADQVNGLPLLGVQTSGILDDLLQQLRAGERLGELQPPRAFVGQLRPYQVRGLSWLAFMRQWGLGACLADDMGLGKTIQAIALLLYERERAAGGLPPALLICPTSVVGNWKREVQRFAPSLRVMVHHGAERVRGEAFVDAAQQHDIVISTYGLVRRDVEMLVEVTWSDIILDESQNIKNPQAKQTQAVRKLQAANRIALTGTPVENRLSELWSLMQFLNPGMLGSQKGFRERFALPIERYQDTAATTQLRDFVGPFILRRLKTDPTIIQDLPEKMEMKIYCSLTPEQVTLYEAVVKTSLGQVEEAETKGDSKFSRQGAVLSALMRLKQICNHPAQFLGDGSALPERSGKLERLTEMLEEVLDVGDRALIFTQFAEMGKLLQGYLQTLFGLGVLYLHGGTPARQRDRMVARFQAEESPLFILSLKAGGTGLNLTAANHVFHFDRWWNPAVEDQATDRAFRIGQRRDVQVHKFICDGTLEERIDTLIEAKKSLAQSVIGAGESWLADLSTDELRDIITLRQET